MLTNQDSVIYPRLTADEPFADETERQLEYFAVDGLRTLCIAQATIDKSYYEVSVHMYLIIMRQYMYVCMNAVSVWAALRSIINFIVI